MSLFFPTLYRRRITDVTVEDLRRLGAACVLLDVDNTLTTHDAPDLTDAVKAWLDEVWEAGLPFIVVGILTIVLGKTEKKLSYFRS